MALDQFAANPIRGIGAGNYDRTYFLERRTTEDIRQAHSIELQTLGELGIVGGALLAVFLVAIAVGFGRRAREAKNDLRARGLAVAAGGTFAVWLVHTSVDWLHLIPGLTGIALCSAAVLVGPWARGRGGRMGPGGSSSHWSAAWWCWPARFSWVAPLSRIATSTRGATSRLRSRRGRSKAKDSQRLNDERLQAYYLESAAWARLWRLSAGAGGTGPRAPGASRMTSSRGRLLGDLATRREEYRRPKRS